MRDGRPEHPERAHLGQDLTVEALVEIGRGNPRLQLLLRVALGGVADQPLLVGQLMIEIERVLPIERQDGRLAHVCSPLVMKCGGALARRRLFRHPTTSNWRPAAWT